MERILILYAAYGGGHLSAAKSIKQYLDTNYPSIQTDLVDCMEFINKAINKLTCSAYKNMAKKAPWAWKRVYNDSKKGILAQISKSSNKLMSRKLKKLFMEYNPDLVISTHPFASQMTGRLIRKHFLYCKLATIMTDFAPHIQWLVEGDYSDYFFVSHSGMKESLIKSGLSEKKIYVTGIPISTRFSKQYNREETYKLLGLQPDKKVILFFGGGEFGLGKTRTIEILKSFINNAKEYQIVAISGKNKKMKSHFEELITPENKNKVQILEYTDKVPELMSISSLVVTKPGGLTISESLASNLPIVIINPIPGQEEENAEFLVSSGSAIWIKNNDNPDEIIYDLLNSEEKLKNMKLCCSKISQKDSTENICKILLENE